MLNKEFDCASQSDMADADQKYGAVAQHVIRRGRRSADDAEPAADVVRIVSAALKDAPTPVIDENFNSILALNAALTREYESLKKILLQKQIRLTTPVDAGLLAYLITALVKSSAQMRGGCGNYDDLTPAEQVEERYQWAKNVLSQVDGTDWLWYLADDRIENPMRGETHAQIAALCASTLEFRLRNLDKNIRTIVQKIFDEKIFSNNLQPTAWIKAVLKEKNENVPLINLDENFTSKARLIKRINDRYDHFMLLLDDRRFTDHQEAGAFFIKAQIAAWLLQDGVLDFDSLPRDMQVDESYRWVTQYVLNKQPSAERAWSDDLTSMVEDQARQSQASALQACQSILKFKLTTAGAAQTKLNSPLKKSLLTAIQDIFADKIRWVHGNLPSIEPPVAASNPGGRCIKARPLPAQPSEPPASTAPPAADLPYVLPVRQPAVPLLADASWQQISPSTSLKDLCELIKALWIKQQSAARASRPPGGPVTVEQVLSADTWCKNLLDDWISRKDGLKTIPSRRLAYYAIAFVHRLFSVVPEGKTKMAQLNAEIQRTLKDAAQRKTTLVVAKNDCLSILRQRIPDEIGGDARKGEDALREALIRFYLHAVDRGFAYADLNVVWGSQEHIALGKGLDLADIKRDQVTLSAAQCVEWGQAQDAAFYADQSNTSEKVRAYFQAHMLEWAMLNRILSPLEEQNLVNGGTGAEAVLHRIALAYAELELKISAKEMGIDAQLDMLSNPLPALPSLYGLIDEFESILGIAHDQLFVTDYINYKTAHARWVMKQYLRDLLRFYVSGKSDAWIKRTSGGTTDLDIAVNRLQGTLKEFLLAYRSESMIESIEVAPRVQSGSALLSSKLVNAPADAEAARVQRYLDTGQLTTNAHGRVVLSIEFLKLVYQGRLEKVKALTFERQSKYWKLLRIPVNVAAHSGLS